ncbi:MAG: hypothetical protein ACK46Q_00585 [Hyphomonas sp.]
MMTHCFSAMSASGPGWTLTVTLIVAAIALTYLVTRRPDAQQRRST